MSQSGSGLSIPVVISGVALVLGYLLWGIGCSMYAAAGPVATLEEPADDAGAGGEPMNGQIDDAEVDAQDSAGSPGAVRIRIRRPGTGAAGVVAVLGVIVFVFTSISYLPEADSVLSFLFAERMWYIILSGVLMSGVILGGLYMARLQAELESGSAFRKKRKKKKIQSPY